MLSLQRSIFSSRAPRLSSRHGEKLRYTGGDDFSSIVPSAWASPHPLRSGSSNSLGSTSPRVGTDVLAFLLSNQTLTGEVNLGLSALSRDAQRPQIDQDRNCRILLRHVCPSALWIGKSNYRMPFHAHVLGLAVLSDEDVRLTLARCDEVAQIISHQRAPGVRATTVALECRRQARMRKSELGLSALSGDLEHDLSPDPLLLVFNEGQFGVHNMPHDLFSGNELRYLLCGRMHVPVAVSEFGSEPVGVSVDLSRPPPANIVNSPKDILGGPVDRKTGNEILLLHTSLLHGFLFWLSVVIRTASLERGALEHEGRILALEFLGYAVPPAIGNRT